MYYIIGAAFCIGFVVGMAFGMVRGKKELAAELRQQCNDIPSEVQRFISGYVK
jgi:hypothetical protein